MIARVLNRHCFEGIQGQEERVPSAYSGEGDAESFVSWLRGVLEADPENVVVIARDTMITRYHLTERGLEELGREAPEGQ